MRTHQDQMRTHQEILDRIAELEQELEHLLEWEINASAKYQSDLKSWGEADDGELRTAQHHSTITNTQIMTLKWVLRTNEQANDKR